MATTDGGRAQGVETWARAIDQMADPLFVTHPTGEIAYVNDAFAALTGYSRDELLGQNPRLLKSGEHDEAFYKNLWETIASGTVWQDEIINKARDGSLYRKRLTITPVKDDAETIIGFVCVALDLEKEAVLETQVRQSQKLEAIGQLASGIAHEINTPTQYIGDNVHFLKEMFGDLVELLDQYEALREAVRRGEDPAAIAAEIERQREAIDLEFILEETPGAIERTLEGNRRVAEVVRAMKEFAHPGAEQMTLTDINHAIHNTLAVSRNEWKYAAEVDTDLEEALPLVPCLPGAINQVFLNLVVNAAHAIQEKGGSDPREKGRIAIASRRDGDCVEVRITDTGTGIPENLREKIFNPFFTTKDVGKGTGQGLAIVRSAVVEQHRGHLAVETELGVGTTFIVRLPIEQSHGEYHADA